MTVDVNTMKCCFLQYLSKLVKKRKFGAKCIFDDTVKTFYAYLTILESGCVISDALWQKIVDFYNEHNCDYTAHSDTSSTTCTISVTAGAVTSFTCKTITVTVVK